jgi:hypothetical protein
MRNSTKKNQQNADCRLLHKKTTAVSQTEDGDLTDLTMRLIHAKLNTHQALMALMLR